MNIKNRFGVTIEAENITIQEWGSIKEPAVCVMISDSVSSCGLTLNTPERAEMIQGLLKLEVESLYNCSSIEDLSAIINETCGEVFEGDCYSTADLNLKATSDNLFRLSMLLLTLSIRKNGLYQR